MDEVIEYKKTADLFSDVKSIINAGKKQAYKTADAIAVYTYWNIGHRIVEEEQEGKERAKYGTALIQKLAQDLSAEFGSSYSKRNLDYYKKFYLCFPDIQIVNTCVHNLSWSHFRRLLAVAVPQTRFWYAKEASQQMWSYRALDRNISTQYYERMLSCQKENLELPSPESETENPLEYIKNPYVAEFLGLKKDADYLETELEQALIDNLEKFIMELGKGFAFVERQKHITTETDDFYIDLVFYNFKMKCFVLFELKTHKLSHQDVGQLDMYVRMYDDLVKDKDDNPTLGVLLCTDTDNTIAKYSVLKDSDQLFAAKYMTYMPSEQELQTEIEKQKQFFLEQHGKEEN